MRQPPLDLLPDSIRVRSQAGVVTGRYVVSLLVGLVLLGVTATHSRLMLDLARQRLRVAEEQADIVLSAEAKADQLRAGLRESREYIRRYDIIALPMELSRIVATVVNELPPSATLDRLDIYAGPRRNKHSSRRRGGGTPDGRVPRELNGELSGFAINDQDVAQLVANIEDLALFDEVSLDFSRMRSVRGHNAREFRVSFSADLDFRYEVIDPEQALPGHTGRVHVQ